jgi:predicted kinase
VTTLYLFCGLPGSGKSTVARVLSEENRAIVLSPDAWMHALGHDGFDAATRSRIAALQWAHAQELLTREQSVILEFGFWTRAERDSTRKRGRELGSRVELWFLDDDRELLWSRVEQRNTAGGADSWPVTRAEFDAFAAAFETPDTDELALYDRGD